MCIYKTCTFDVMTVQVKHWGPESGPGGDWAVRVHAQHADDSRPSQRRRRVSFAMYLSDEDTPKVSRGSTGVGYSHGSWCGYCLAL